MTPRLLAWEVWPFITLENFPRRTGFGGWSDEFGYSPQSRGVYWTSGDTVWGAAKYSSRLQGSGNGLYSRVGF